MFSSESLSRLDEAKAQLDNAQNVMKKGGTPSSASVAKPAPAPAPAPVVEEAPKAEEKPAPAKPSFAGFDMSELENLAAAAEANPEV